MDFLFTVQFDYTINQKIIYKKIPQKAPASIIGRRFLILFIEL